MIEEKPLVWEIKMLQKWLKVNANKKLPTKAIAKVRASKSHYHLTFIIQ
tara:strand:+ start:481 stop:627 length:147 start_codon:yes stop_codon:yes gene_type:complete